MLKKIIKCMADEVTAASLEPIRIVKLAVKLQTLSDVMKPMHSYECEDAFFAVFPVKEDEDGESK